MVFEALTSLEAAEGILKPVVEALQEIQENSVDDSKMVLIPAGTFLYGSRNDDKNAHSDEKTQMVVYLPAFYMDVFPVINEQFCKFLNNKMPEKNELQKWIDLEGSFENEK